MTNYFTLCFPSELEALEIARRFRLVDSDGDIISSMGHLGDIDEIGQAFEPAIRNADGEEILAPVAISGYFVNISLRSRDLPWSLEKYVVPYGRGRRVFAGTDASEDAR